MSLEKIAQVSVTVLGCCLVHVQQGLKGEKISQIIEDEFKHYLTFSFIKMDINWYTWLTSFSSARAASTASMAFSHDPAADGLATS
jgi:hypothetical protein